MGFTRFAGSGQVQLVGAIIATAAITLDYLRVDR